MSAERLTWLNTMVLVGMTESRKGFVDPVDPCESQYDAEGRSWHFRQELQGAEANHYPGPIPLADVKRRLFHWEVLEGDHRSIVRTTDGSGVEGLIEFVDPTKKSIIRPPGALGPDDKGAIMGVFGIESYESHNYMQWLVEKVQDLVADELVIGSAGLLKMGAQAFVSIEVPDTIMTPEGVPFKPRILAVTSFDGSLATRYKGVITVAVCDNTMRAGLAEFGPQFRVKHTSRSSSTATTMNMKQALGIAHNVGDAFATEVAELCDMTVTDDQWTEFLEATAPSMKSDGSGLKTGAGATRAANKRTALDDLWRKDIRVAPWAGSAWGVVQAVNTYTHWVQSVNGESKADDDAAATAVRLERNMDMTVTGGFDKLDADTFGTLQSILTGTTTTREAVPA